MLRWGEGCTADRYILAMFDNRLGLCATRRLLVDKNYKDRVCPPKRSIWASFLPRYWIVVRNGDEIEKELMLLANLIPFSHHL